MPFVDAVCPNCGGALKINNGDRAAICPYCKKAYIVEDAINNYVTNYTTHIDNLHADVVKVNDEKSLENQVLAGETFIKFEDYESARKVFTAITENQPYYYQGWWGLLRAETYDFRQTTYSAEEYKIIKKHFNNAINVCDNPSEIMQIFSAFDKEVRTENAHARQIVLDQIAEAEFERDEAKKQFDEKGAILDSQLSSVEKNLRKRRKELEIKRKFRFRKWLTIINFCIGLCIAFLVVHATGADSYSIVDYLGFAIWFIPIGFAVGWCFDSVTRSGPMMESSIIDGKMQKDKKAGILYKDIKRIQEEKRRLSNALISCNEQIASLKKELPETIDGV